MTAWARPRGRPERANDISLATGVSWGFLGLLLLGVSAYAITDGATRLGLLGQRQEARVMECSAQGEGVARPPTRAWWNWRRRGPGSRSEYVSTTLPLIRRRWPAPRGAPGSPWTKASSPARRALSSVYYH